MTHPTSTTSTRETCKGLHTSGNAMFVASSGARTREVQAVIRDVLPGQDVRLEQDLDAVGADGRQGHALTLTDLRVPAHIVKAAQTSVDTEHTQTLGMKLAIGGLIHAHTHMHT
jgi:hypothetical protein